MGRTSKSISLVLVSSAVALGGWLTGDAVRDAPESGPGGEHHGGRHHTRAGRFLWIPVGGFSGGGGGARPGPGAASPSGRGGFGGSGHGIGGG